MLNEIIKDLKKLRTDERLKVSDEVLFDAGVRIYNSKNIRQGYKSQSQNNATIKSTLATEPQKKLLKKLKWKGDFDSLTKIKAIEEIDKRIK